MQAGWRRLCLTALFALLVAGCSPSSRVGCHAPAGRAADMEELVTRLKHTRWRARASAAKALGEARDIRALWPLTLAAATDTHPRVRRAAAEAITWVGLDPDSDMVRACRKRLMMRFASVQFDGVSLFEAVGMLGQAGGTSWHIDLGSLEEIGVHPEQAKVTVDARDLTLAEAWCRVLVAAGKKAAFIIDTGCPVHVASVESLIDHVQAAHRQRQRRAELRRLAERTEEGREVLRKLQMEVQEAHFHDIEFSSVLEFLSQAGEFGIEADWEALRLVGIGKSTALNFVEVSPPGGVRMKGGHTGPVPIEKLLWLILDDVGGATPLEFIVEDGGVFISTREEIDKLLAERKKASHQAGDMSAD